MTTTEAAGAPNGAGGVAAPTTVHQWAEKKRWRQGKVGVAHRDVAALQENKRKAGDNVVCNTLYDGQGRRCTKAWAPGVPLLMRRDMSVARVKQVGTKGCGEVYDVATKKGNMVIINMCHTERR